MALEEPPATVLVQEDPDGIVLDGRSSLFAGSQVWNVVSSTFTREETDLFGDIAVSRHALGDETSGFSLVRQFIPPATIGRRLIERTDLGTPNWTDPANNIANKLDQSCSGCHQPKPNGVSNIPVYLDGVSRYWDVLDLIDFEQPSQSLLLTKPGGLRHGYNGDKASVFGNAFPGFEYFDGSGDILRVAQRGDWSRTLSDWIQGGPRWNPDTGISSTCQLVDRPIPDNTPDGLESVMYVGPAFVISDMAVLVDLTHSHLSDVRVELTHLDSGATVVLIDRPQDGGDGSCNFEATGFWFTDAETENSKDLCILPADDFYSVSPVTPFNALAGGLTSGFWRVRVTDLSAGESGSIHRWCLHSW